MNAPHQKIHPTAIIHEDVVLGHGVVIHPYVVIEAGVTIGDGVEIFPHAYIGREPKATAAISRMPVFERKLTIGAHCSIGPHTTIYYDVEIGENTLIGDHSSIREQTRIGDRCVIARSVMINYNTKIGNRTKIMDLSEIAGNCVFGDDVFISAKVGTATDNNIANSRTYGQHCQGQIIEDGATIGLAAILLPDIRIGKRAMVAAGSVVTKDVPEHTLVMGVPARVIRQLAEEVA